MIEIKIYGAHYDSILKKKLHDFSFFYLHELMPRVRKICIKIQCIKNLIKREGIYGDCTVCDNQESNYDYIIRLNADVCSYTMLTTLSHEFVHLKQFHKRQLRLNYNGASWKGQTYHADYAYDDCPWEAEASSLELKLYEKAAVNLKEYK